MRPFRTPASVYRKIYRVRHVLYLHLALVIFLSFIIGLVCWELFDRNEIAWLIAFVTAISLSVGLVLSFLANRMHQKIHSKALFDRFHDKLLKEYFELRPKIRKLEHRFYTEKMYRDMLEERFLETFAVSSEESEIGVDVRIIWNFIHIYDEAAIYLQIDPEIASALEHCDYYYFAWFRGFLLDICALYKRCYLDSLKPNEITQLPLPHWVTNVIYLDKFMQKTGYYTRNGNVSTDYNRHLHPVYKKYFAEDEGWFANLDRERL